MSTPQEALVRQAYEQLQAGQLEEAVEIFSEALSMGPADTEALRGRGMAYVQLKQWPSASADFESATRSDPSNTDNWVDLGLSQALEGKIYPAIQTFETLLEQSPACVRGYIEFGLLYIRLGAIPRGRQLLQQALDVRPTLDQRRRIEAVLQEQARFDKKRFYRPDFAALQQSRPGLFTGLMQRLRRLFRSARNE